MKGNHGMNNLQNYSNHFFDELEVFEDLSRGHSYKAYLRQAVLQPGNSKEPSFIWLRYFGRTLKPSQTI